MKTIIFGILLVCSLPSFSQTASENPKPRKGFLGLYFGPSFPTGNFGDRSWNNNQAGFAKMGYQMAVADFGIKFVPGFGIAASIKGSSIPMDVQYIADQYAQEYGGQFIVKSSRWGFGGFHVGPFVSIPLKYFDIDFRFMTGFMIASSPDLEVTWVNTGETQTQGGEIGSSIAVSVGAGIRYHLSRRFSLVANGEYMRARPTFIIEQYPGNNYQTTTVYQNVSMINTMFGIALRIF